MTTTLEQEIQKLILLAGDRGAEARLIPTRDIVVSDWVRF